MLISVNIRGCAPYIKGYTQGAKPLAANLCGLEPQLIKLEFIIYLPKLKVSL